MPLTYTGRRVVPENGVSPSLLDIAIGLSRMPRFAGQTSRWFSVLDHTLFGLELMKKELEGGVPAVRHDDESSRRFVLVAWLLHDAHEAITGDVPTDIKGADLRSAQTSLDCMIYRTFLGRAFMPDDVKRLVKEVDRLCLAAEARVLATPAWAGKLSLFGPAVDDAEKLLRGMLVSVPNIWHLLPLGIPPFAPYSGEYGQDQHPAVKAYLRHMEELL